MILCLFFVSAVYLDYWIIIFLGYFISWLFSFCKTCLFTRYYFRLRFLGKVLSVERVGSDTKNTDSQSDSQSGKDSSGPLQLSLKDASNPVSSVYGGEPIAPRLGVDYPFPPHLEYVSCICWGPHAYYLFYENYLLKFWNNGLHSMV